MGARRGTRRDVDFGEDGGAGGGWDGEPDPCGAERVDQGAPAGSLMARHSDDPRRRFGRLEPDVEPPNGSACRAGSRRSAVGVRVAQLSARGKRALPNRGELFRYAGGRGGDGADRGAHAWDRYAVVM